jgi:hypothetical protein
MADSTQVEPLLWRKSTYSVTGECVTVAVDGDEVLVRDSSTESDFVVLIPSAAWHALLAKIRGGY